MKVAALITRILLGLMFTIFGLNGFIHFLQMPAPANPLAVQYMTVLTESHYFAFVFLVQLIAGILLLIGRFVPLALALLAPVLANILLYHSLMDPSGLPLVSSRHFFGWSPSGPSAALSTAFCARVSRPPMPNVALRARKAKPQL